VISQRDAFFNALFLLAKQDRNIVLVSADMGAPSLDQWRLDLPSQYLNVGIAEANAVSIATGLAKLGKKVFVYAIAPFISLRCYEQVKLGPCAHNLPITLVGVGAGFSYEDSGPTHHTLEDVAIMSALPNMTVITVTDSVMAEALARVSSGPTYIRLDRATREPVYTEKLPVLERGFSFFNWEARVKSPFFITQGDLIHSVKDTGRPYVDVFSLPFDVRQFGRIFHPIVCRFPYILLEESFGGLYEPIVSVLKIPPYRHIKVTRASGYNYDYGGREQLRSHYGLDKASLLALCYES